VGYLLLCSLNQKEERAAPKDGLSHFSILRCPYPPRVAIIALALKMSTPATSGVIFLPVWASTSLMKALRLLGATLTAIGLSLAPYPG